MTETQSRITVTESPIPLNVEDPPVTFAPNFEQAIRKIVQEEFVLHARRIERLAPSFIAGIREGHEQAERGETIPLDEARRQFDLD